MIKPNRFNFVLLLGVFLSIIIALSTTKPPKAVEEDADLKLFSAERAFKHTKEVAKHPHSMATEEHAEVRNYIIEELKKLGLETSVQSTTAIFDFRRSVSAGYVHNVVGVLKGKEEGKALLITGHYDSQPNTKAAADDGAAVAAILEAARALKELPKLKNDVIFLFSDGEESGLFGAQAFVQEHPLRNEIGLVLNLEARGSKGVSFTYEVSEDNGWIMREYGKVVRYPIASSLAYEVYKLMSNNSDFTIYKMAGYAGFNTAFIEGYVNYHSLTDSPENLSLRSLQHQGSYIMDIAKHFGDLPLNEMKDEDLVYFNLFRYLLISYPQSWNLFIIALIIILFMNVMFWGVRTKKISIWRSLISFLLFLGTLGLCLGAVILLQKGILWTYPWYENFYDANFYNAPYYFIAFASLCLLMFSLVYALVIKKLKALDLWVGALLFGIVLLVVIQIYIPTGLYLMALPLILILSWILLKFSFKWKCNSWQRNLSLLIIFFPIITMTVQMIKILFVTFSLGMAMGGSLLSVLLIGFLMPVFISTFKMKRWALSVFSFMFLLSILFIAHLESDYNEERPLQSKMMYAQNYDTEESLWVAPNAYMDEWKEQFFNNPEYGALTEIFPNAGRTRIKNLASWMDVKPPLMSILSDTVINDQRVLTINLKSQGGAENGQFYIHKDAGIAKVFINDLEIKDRFFYENFFGGCHYFNFYGIYKSGINLEIHCKPNAEFELIMIEKKLGMPIFEEGQKMPTYIVPAPGYESNQSILRKSWKL